MPIPVTQPFLPPLEKFLPYLREIWSSGILTNGGQFHQQLELSLRQYLAVEHLALFSSGTTALITAIKALDIQGEVITTPYTFVATSHVLAWSGITPVFVDIDPVTLNLNPARIEAAITPKTTAILGVHCYGTPCDVVAIDEIACKHRLRVIYDAAHAFGVEDPGGSILRHGDVSAISFHATKTFSTMEGGALVCLDEGMLARVNRMKNFGFVSEVAVSDVGINGKLNEISAAFGLLQLDHLATATARCAEIDRNYRVALREVEGIRCVDFSRQLRPNHGYFPVLVEDCFPVSRDDLYSALTKSGVRARRYFYPLVSSFPMYAQHPSSNKDNLPVAHDIARKVICLPIFPALSDEQQQMVIDVIRKSSLRK